MRIVKPDVLLLGVLQCGNLRLLLFSLLPLLVRLPDVNCWIIENDSMVLHRIVERTRDNIGERTDTKRSVGRNSFNYLSILVLHQWYRIPTSAEHLLERLWFEHGVRLDIIWKLRVSAVGIRLSPLRFISSRVRIRIIPSSLSLFI